MRKFFTFVLFTLLSFLCVSQDCPYITGAMINACGMTTMDEGNNEFVAFNTGGNGLSINNFRFSYHNSSPPPFNTSATLYINGGASGTVLTSNPGISLTGCSSINVVTDVTQVIPAGANVVMMYSSTNLTTFDLSNQCSGGAVYVIFINTVNTAAADGWSAMGNFANNPASGSLRYLGITNTASPCNGANNIVSYQGTAVQSWGSNADGNAVLWDASGNPTYVNGGCSAIAMPVEMILFEVVKKETISILSFSTASETNNDYFTIERSGDGKSYDAIGTIEGAGNSSKEISYEFVDEKPLAGINYYRIKQTDFDGRFSYSEIRSVRFKGLNNVNVTPRTTEGQINITTDLEAYTIDIHNAAGQVVKTFPAMGLDQTISIESLVAGVYYIRINSGTETETLRVIKL
ncbi:MAG: T9SS type A sorting domain-containing protein [Saprospiraceae bacterium]|nr:T9SS type A sorting domain-containing protein [Saprospiraceae bacterium]